MQQTKNEATCLESIVVDIAPTSRGYRAFINGDRKLVGTGELIDDAIADAVWKHCNVKLTDNARERSQALGVR